MKEGGGGVEEEEVGWEGGMEEGKGGVEEEEPGIGLTDDWRCLTGPEIDLSANPLKHKAPTLKI